jgi:hypothetical protein
MHTTGITGAVGDVAKCSAGPGDCYMSCLSVKSARLEAMQWQVALGETSAVCMHELTVQLHKTRPRRVMHGRVPMCIHAAPCMCASEHTQQVATHDDRYSNTSKARFKCLHGAQDMVDAAEGPVQLRAH